jgi:Tfp pilus assembly protein PilO
MRIDRPIAIALILFIILLLVLFLVMPEYKTFRNLQTEIGEKKAEYNAKYEYYSEIKKTYDDLQSRSEDIKKIDDAMPQVPDRGKIIYFFQVAAQENGMMLKDLFLSGGASGGAGNVVQDMSFSMDLLGNYPSLEKFMNSVENSSRIFEITSISFSAASAPSAGSSQSQFQAQQAYTFTLQIKTHSY